MTQKYQLPNGMNVILYESHKSPVVSVQMWVRTGSADEGKGIEGISHFIEHLVFKGTDKYGVGEIASKVEGSGGQLNAYTSFDQTVFYITISKEFSDSALDMISQMMGYPKFDPKEIDNEREVVIEEIKRSMDSLSRFSSQNLFSTVYKKHAYGLPVIGYEKIIAKVSAKKIADYYHSRYVPQNMTLVVVGDFQNKSMKKEVEKYFAGFKKYPLKKVVRKKEPAQKTPRISVVENPFKEARLHIAWPVCSAKHKDAAALDVLAMILGQGEASRLNSRIRNERGLVNYIFASAFTPQDAGLFTVSSGLEPENLKEVTDETLKVLEEILSKPAGEEELANAIKNFESEELFTLQTVDGIAGKLGHYEFLMKDPNYFEVFMKQIRAVTPGDLIKVARKYLKPENISFILNCEKDKKAGEKIAKTWIPAYKKMYKSASLVKIAKSRPAKLKPLKFATGKRGVSKVETHTLSNGVEVITLENHDVPVYHVQAAMLGGALLENKSNMGLSNLLASTWVSGTKTKSELELHREMESISAGISAFSGRNSVGLKMSSLTQNLESANKLFMEVLTAPNFSPEVISREKKQIQQQIQNRADNPGHIASQSFNEEMFKGHPYSFDTEGSMESISTLDQKTIEALYQRSLQSKNLKLAVVGSFDTKRILASFEAGLKNISRENMDLKISKSIAITENAEVHHPMKKEQTHILLGYPGFVFEDQRKYALYVVNAVLSGQGGRLFLELRDKESLAYSVSPMHMEGLYGGYFGGYIACSPEKTEKAISMMRIEFDKLMNQKIGDDELQRAKNYLIGKNDIALQKNSSIASTLLFDYLYIGKFETWNEYKDKIQKVTAAEAMQVAKEIFTRPEVLSIAGPERTV